jgi:pimeloyl-ACP methyl ester carboxylesterase
VWSTGGNPGIVLVHGGTAHAHWWSFVAPLFTTEWHAVALDLGCGPAHGCMISPAP